MSERIKLEMTLMESVMAMSDGNPGAITALVSLMNASPNVDPQSMMRELSPLLTLDSNGIYGSDIWLLYKGVCNKSSIHCLAILRAIQLGIIGIEQVMLTMAGQDTLDLDWVLEKVKARLTDFGRA
jgi:hypothetical protein